MKKKKNVLDTVKALYVEIDALKRAEEAFQEACKNFCRPFIKAGMTEEQANDVRDMALMLGKNSAKRRVFIHFQDALEAELDKVLDSVK